MITSNKDSKDSKEKKRREDLGEGKRLPVQRFSAYSRQAPLIHITRLLPLVVSMRIANKEKKSQPTTKALSVELRQKDEFTNA